MLEKLKGYIQANELFQKSEKVLLAVSGGIDSIVLSHLIHQSSYDFAIAHCNFQLRGNESDEDEVFVRELSVRMDVPFFSIQFETELFAKQNKIGIQEAARNLRYEWLEKIALENQFHHIATAHHLDDNIETVLFNFSRGTGIRGMRGMLPKRGNIIRPLLFAKKSEIEKYAAENDIAFREDASNLTDKYSRNRIRHHVIPVLEKVAPGFQNNAERTIQRMLELEKWMESWVAKAKEELVNETGKFIEIDLKRLGSYPSASSLLFELIQPYGFNITQVENIMQSVENQSGATFLSSTHEANISSFSLQIKCQENYNGVNIVIENDDSIIKLEAGCQIELSKHPTPPDKYPSDPNVAYFSLKEIQWPLRVRNWQEGDYFHPFGMDGHRKKLQDYFSDKKLSRFEKEEVLILESGNDICWVVGMRTDERFKVRNSTKPCLKVVYSPTSR